MEIVVGFCGTNLGGIMKENKKEKLYNKLVMPYYKSIYTFILNSVRDSELAKDLTQNTMEKAWNRIEQLRNEDSSCSWLFTIARNEMSWYFRIKTKGNRVFCVEESLEGSNKDVEDFEQNVLSEITARESQREAAKALLNVKPEYQSVLWLRIIGAKPFAEISEMLGINESTLRSQYIRGLRILRQEYYKLAGGKFYE